MDAAKAEHIFLASDEPEERRPETVRMRFTVRNRIRRIVTELALYEEGHLAIQEQRARNRGSERCIDLRHLDPKPVLSRRVAIRARRAALYAIAAGAVLGGLAYFGVLPLVAASGAASALLVAAIAACAFVYRTDEQIQFVTYYGRVPVVTLVANFGCMRACRAFVPTIVTAIKQAAAHAAGDRNTRLREELREHYRLRAGGVLTPADCMGAVQRILARFE